MFAIDIKGRRYFVTARHIAKHMTGGKVQVMHDGKWNSYAVEIAGNGGGGVDVSVVTLPDPLIQKDSLFPLSATLEGAILGGEMMFLGFPAGYDTSTGFHLNNGFPIPLVKYARLSTMPLQGHPMWLDGHNNPGFSGAPLCFTPDINKPSELAVAGVVVSYKQIRTPVYTRDGGETEMYVEENMGLLQAWNIKYAVDLIDKNPIGLEITQ